MGDFGTTLIDYSVPVSILLAIPVIVLAGGLEAYRGLTEQVAVDWQAVAVGMSVSAASAYLFIHWFLKLLDRIGMLPFVLYRLALVLALVPYWVT